MKKKNKKKKKILEFNQKLSKFSGSGEKLVKLPKNFLHLGLCELRRDRIKNWTKVFKYGNKVYTQVGPESLNMYDKTILFDILRAFDDIENRELKLRKDNDFLKKVDKKNEKALTLLDLMEKKGKEDGKENLGQEIAPYYLFTTIKMNFNEFCRKYVGSSRMRRNNVIKTIKRLLFTKTTCEEKIGNNLKEFATFHYLVDFSLHNGEASFTVSKQLRESAKNGLYIHYDMFKSIKSSIGKALYLFFIGNRNTTFSYSTIKDAIGLTDEDFQNRALIKQGLESLKQSQFIKEYSVETRANDIYYVFKYGIIDNANKVNELQSSGNGNVLQIQNFQIGVTDGDKSVTDGDKSVTDGDKSVTEGDKSVTDGERGVQVLELFQ